MNSQQLQQEKEHLKKNDNIQTNSPPSESTNNVVVEEAQQTQSPPQFVLDYARGSLVYVAIVKHNNSNAKAHDVKDSEGSANVNGNDISEDTSTSASASVEQEKEKDDIEEDPLPDYEVMGKHYCMDHKKITDEKNTDEACDTSKDNDTSDGNDVKSLQPDSNEMREEETLDKGEDIAETKEQDEVKEDTDDDDDDFVLINDDDDDEEHKTVDNNDTNESEEATQIDEAVTEEEKETEQSPKDETDDQKVSKEEEDNTDPYTKFVLSKLIPTFVFSNNRSQKNISLNNIQIDHNTMMASADGDSDNENDNKGDPNSNSTSNNFSSIFSFPSLQEEEEERVDSNTINTTKEQWFIKHYNGFTYILVTSFDYPMYLSCEIIDVLSNPIIVQSEEQHNKQKRENANKKAKAQFQNMFQSTKSWVDEQKKRHRACICKRQLQREGKNNMSSGDLNLSIDQNDTTTADISVMEEKTTTDEENTGDDKSCATTATTTTTTTTVTVDTDNNGAAVGSHHRRNSSNNNIKEFFENKVPNWWENNVKQKFDNHVRPRINNKNSSSSINDDSDTENNRTNPKAAIPNWWKNNVQQKLETVLPNKNKNNSNNNIKAYDVEYDNADDDTTNNNTSDDESKEKRPTLDITSKEQLTIYCKIIYAKYGLIDPNNKEDCLPYQMLTKTIPNKFIMSSKIIQLLNNVTIDEEASINDQTYDSIKETLIIQSQQFKKKTQSVESPKRDLIQKIGTIVGVGSLAAFATAGLIFAGPEVALLSMFAGEIIETSALMGTLGVWYHLTVKAEQNTWFWSQDFYICSPPAH